MKNKLNWGNLRIPTRNTIENWVKKSGYSIKEPPSEKITSVEYAEIIDESLMIGGQSMLLTLGMDARSKKTAITHKDVEILNIGVSSSWDGNRIWYNLLDTQKRVGHPPKYIISDNGPSLKKGINKAGYTHIRDVSHTIALIMEHIYKNDKKFIAFVDRLKAARKDTAMSKVGYLLPPKQRAMARFMNLTDIVEWSNGILKKLSRLGKNEKEAFSFIYTYKSLINELHDDMLCINAVQKEIIQNGLSNKTLKLCMPFIKDITKRANNKRRRELAHGITKYIKDETNKLCNYRCKYNASSDIIESIFGTYKYRKASNRLYGITTYVLLLPLYTRLVTSLGDENFDFKGSLEKYRLADIEDWKNENLKGNLVKKRKMALNSVWC